MKKMNNYLQLNLAHNISSRLSFIGYFIITLIQAVQINSITEKNIIKNGLDITEVIVLFYIFIINITIMIKLRRIVSLKI